MSGQHVLLFAYHFPPENAVGGLRPYRFYKYLPRHGYQCHVITAADLNTRPDLEAEYVPDPFLHNSQRGPGWHIERSVRKLVFPGAVGTQWAKQAYRAGVHFLHQHSGERVVIFSTYPPIGPHLAGWWLAKRHKLPWVADLRDPVAGNPANARLGKHTHFAYHQLERSSFADASCVIANTDEAARVLKTKFPSLAGRFHLLWNGFDPEQRIEPLPLAGDVQVLSHVGELYEGRTVAPLIESFRRLLKAGRVGPRCFKLQLVGSIEASCLPAPAVVEAAKSEGWLDIVPQQIPKQEALRLAQTSHSLLIVQPHSAIQVPGKLFEYLQIGRPILAFVPRNSSIERVLEPSGIPYRCVYPDCPPESFDQEVLSFLKMNTTAQKPSAWFEETFNAESQTATLARWLDGLKTR